MSKPTLKIVQGFLGAGKTTYSKWLASQTGEVRLNADEYCEQHFSKESLEEDWDTCFSKAISILYHDARNYLESGKSVILDFGFWDRKSRDYARNIAQNANAAFQHLYLDTSDEIILDRLKKRSGVIAEKNLKNFEKLKKSFEEPFPDEQAIRLDPKISYCARMI